MRKQDVKSTSISPALYRQPTAVPIMNFGSEFVPTRPLYVLLDESPTGTFTAANYDLELIGVGDSDFEAIEDFKVQVVEVFAVLSENSQDLSTVLADKLRFLRSLQER
jgi:hypothetical protein